LDANDGGLSGLSSGAEKTGVVCPLNFKQAREDSRERQMNEADLDTKVSYPGSDPVIRDC
jgi:hypothetical protein